MTVKSRLAKGEIITVSNSQITGYSVRRHSKGHGKLPYELLWAYRVNETTSLCWAFFPTLSAAAQAAEDLVNNARNRVTGEPR